MNMEEVWSTRSENYKNRIFIGLENTLPQSHEDEQQLFAQLDLRKDEILDQVQDDNVYMIIHDDGIKMMVAVLVNDYKEVPEGMVPLTLPEENYVVFRFEEKYIGDFWNYFCVAQNQQKYNLCTIKARFEIFNKSLQPNGITEIYYPTKS